MNTATNTKIQTAIQQEYVQTGTAPTRTNPPVVEPVRESCNIRDYVLGLEYLNEEPEGYYHEEGRINLLAGGRVEYTLKDHLGNGRVYCYHNAALNQAKTIQATHYYAFGLPIQKLSPNFEAAVGVEANNYQYNGIELVEDFGLHVNHAQFRTLNPQTGAWWQIDPKPTYGISNYAAMANNPIRYSDMLGDTIKTDFGNNQFASAGYYLWASTKEGKKFHKRYGEGGRFGHVSVLFKVGSMDGKTEDGGTQVYYNKKGENPIVIGRGKLTSQMISAAKNGTPDSYISFVVSMNGAEYSPNNFNDMGTQLSVMVDTYEHESQHIDQHMSSFLTEGIKLPQDIHHTNMRPYGPLYQERRNALLELRPFWESTYQKRKEKYGWGIEEFILNITNGFANE